MHFALQPSVDLLSSVQPSETLPTGIFKANYRYRIARNCNVTLARPVLGEENPVGQLLQVTYPRSIKKTSI